MVTSKIKVEENNEEFPCLMEYRMQGTIPVGIYLVKEIKASPKNNYRFSVCLVAVLSEGFSKVGEMYYKEDLNPKEWFFLPEGMEVKLINGKSNK